MLEERIVETLKFFDLQDIPLTLFELHKFLLAPRQSFDLDERLELVKEVETTVVSLHEVAKTINDMPDKVEEVKGYFCIKGRREIVQRRLRNYLLGLNRERRIRRFVPFLAYLPFVRGVALGGSQALGQPKTSSDIDLLIFTEKGFLWLARTFVTAFFHLLGVRRHKLLVADRFCLNHYLATPKKVEREKNLYKAMEYGRLRPLVFQQAIFSFWQQNRAWLLTFFPNLEFHQPRIQGQPFLQAASEFLLAPFARRLENWLKKIQIPRIKQDEFTFVLTDELSFHPESRHLHLLKEFFKV